MRNWVVLLIAACLGTGVGLGVTIFERVTHEELFLPAEFAAYAKSIRAARIPTAEARPKIEFVNGQDYDFGSMERYSKKRHTFLIKNVGDAPLDLEVRRTTCKCTISSIDGKSIKPGETGKVEVEWTGQTPLQEPNFKQGVEIGTNDPDMQLVTMIISGYVTESIRALPHEIVLGQVLSDKHGFDGNTGFIARVCRLR